MKMTSQPIQRRLALIPALLLAGLCALLSTTDLEAANTHAAQLVRSSSQYFSAPSSTSLSVTGDFTFEAWVKITTPPSSGEQYSLINKDISTDRSYSVWYVNNGGTLKLVVSIFGSNHVYPSDYLAVTRNDDLGANWHHVAIVCTIANSNSTKVTFYVDGVSLGNGSVADGNGATDINNGTADVRIGRGHTSEFFDGYIDDVRLWGATRTGQQITNNMFKELVGTESNLRGYWKLNNSLADSTPNGNTLTNNNSATFENAGLIPLQSEPIIETQPANTFAVLGGPASLIVVATSDLLESYQWYFSHSPIFGATNSILSLSNVQPVNVGIYSVIVSNDNGSVTSSNAFITIPTPGIDDDGDGLDNTNEIQFGTETLNPDTDGDSLTDYQELFVYNTDPLKPDTDGDGMPDGWEVQHGLNPRVNDAADDLDGDGVSNLVEFNRGFDPQNKYSTSGTISDYAVVNGVGTNQFFYDRNNRLIGAEFDRGLALAYVYDGNDNLVRQVAMKHDANTNGLPDVWEFLNSLTNNASAFTDTDGDGWTDYQEWKAGTSANATNSAPNLLGNPGTNIASLVLPFTPSNFIVAVGQLDGLGPEEIVLGADGNPGTNINFLLVLTQGATTWSTQRVDVGPFGITSIAVGQVTNRPSAGIYFGLRGTTNGSGRVMEFTSNGGLWQSNVVALSTNQAAFVVGVRGQEVLVSLATTNLPDGSLSAANFGTNWNLSLIDTNTSHRGLGTVGKLGAGQATLRLLDTAGIAFGEIGATNVWPISGLAAYYPLDGNANDSSGNGKHGVNLGANGAADRFGIANGACSFGGGSYINLTGNRPISGIQSAFTVSAWFNANNENLGNVFVHRGHLRDVVLGKAQNGRAAWCVWDNGGMKHELQSQPLPSGQWLHAVGTYDGSMQRLYVNGNLVASNLWTGIVDWDANYFSDGIAGHPTDTSYRFDGLIDDVRIYSRALTELELALIQNGIFTGLIAEPSATRTNNWRGGSLVSGFLRVTNGSSIFYTFTDDKDANGLIDFADDFVTAEYLVTGTNASLLTLSRQPIAALSPAQSYGLASVNFLNTSNEVFFTGEPDGQLFAWTASSATNPLQRQLFSGHHAGKAWHALASVKTFEPGEALIGLRVDPTNQSRCDVILWSPQSQLPQVASLPNTAPAAAVLPTTNTLGSLALVTVRLWDAEGNASTPFLQYQLSGSTNWQDATLLSLDGGAYSTNTRVAASPGGVNHTVVWKAQADLVANVVTNILLRARARDMTLLGDWSAGTPFTVQTTANPDSDNDGMLDSWEIQYFGNLSHNGLLDSDSDGFTDLQEYIADTNPDDANSKLQITSADRTPIGLVINWQGGVNATQFIQRISSLTTNDWQQVFTNLPPTPISGSYTDSFGTNAMQFYRLKVTR